MPFYKTIRLSLLLCLFFNWAFSQNYPVKHYSAANELPNNAVRSLLVDSNNILWIGTENGVVKKENDEFNYLFEEDGLALNSCWAIAEDKNKKLWFGSYGKGVSIYDGYNFKFISEEEGLVHNEITTLWPYENKMYVGTSDGISVIDINTFEVQTLDHSSNNELFRISDFFKFRNEIYGATYRSGIYKILNKENNSRLVKVNDHKFVYSVFVDNDSIYSSNKGFFTKSPLVEYLGKNPPSAKKSGTSIIWDHVKTNGDRIFAAAWGIYDTNGGIYELQDRQMNSRASEFDISSKEVTSLAYDPNFERLYVGTKDAGLFEVALDPQIKFKEFEGKSVLSFAETENTSAFIFNDGIVLKNDGTEQKISLANLKTWQRNYVLNTKLPLPKHKDNFYELDHSTKAGEIKIYDIKVSGELFWVNTNIGIFVINEAAELYRYLPLHSEEINFTPNGDLIETHPYGGIRIYKDLDAFTYTYYSPEVPTTPTMIVNSLRKAEKTYFVSVFSGLFLWKNDRFISYLHDGIWKEEQLRHITSLGENIAVSSEFGDVFIIKDDSAQFQILKKIPRAEIEGNTISFLKDYKGILIIGTEKGLTLYANDRTIFLDQEQGLKQPLLSAEVDKDRLYIGSKSGYYNIDLQDVIHSEALIDHINLKEIFINNSKFSVGSVRNKDEINLDHDQNTILLKFNTNAHPFPHKLRYRYRLNSGDDWSLPSVKPEIFLPFLPADDYEVEVKVLDKSTGLSYSQQLLTLSILPPFWKTWWFLLMIMSLGILMVYGIYRFQILQSRKFEEQKRLIQKRFEETKMEALLAQMNPHFIFNAMNSIQYYIMESDIDNATVFLGDFARLIRLNLDHCTKPRILLIEEIEYLQSYIRVENTRFNNALKVEMDIDPAIDVYEIQIPTMLLQTFVENVFVHAFPPGVNDPTLKITFKRLQENVLQCKIEDNGVGFTPGTTNKLHNSRGVSLVKERLILLGYNIDEAISITSSKNKGTTVELRLQI